MNKSRRIEDFLKGLEVPSGTDPNFAGYFHCFSKGWYFEAHDVLEQLWLRSRGDQWRFYKGLIQLAGAFVHLQKQFKFPQHPKHGQRLRPAVRLLRLSIDHLKPFGSRYMELQLEPLIEFCKLWASQIEASGFKSNPWSPERKPRFRFGESNWVWTS